MLRRLLNFLIVVDQLVFSIITLGKAYPNETLSSAAYRGELDNRLLGKLFRPIIDKIMFFDPNHCEQSYQDVKHGKLLPESYKD